MNEKRGMPEGIEAGYNKSNQQSSRKNQQENGELGEEDKKYIQKYENYSSVKKMEKLKNENIVNNKSEPKSQRIDEYPSNPRDQRTEDIGNTKAEQSAQTYSMLPSNITSNRPSETRKIVPIENNSNQKGIQNDKYTRQNVDSNMNENVNR